MAAADGARWDASGNILVVVRVRPLSTDEKRKREEDVLTVFEQTNIVIKDPGHTATNEMRQKRLRERQYAFDASYAPDISTEKVYQGTVRHLIDGVLAGHNATVFAYGATGSGKTFTMLGTPSSPGVMVRTLADLYSRMDKRAAGEGASFKVKLSYVEVYNENVRDLLAPPPAPGSSDEYLDLREDPLRGNCVAGVSEHVVADSHAVMGLLSEGNRRRTQEPTAANRESSRSHAVLQIVISARDAIGGKIRTGKLSLIDLAGSERAANTHNRGIRLLEGANINRSLLALGNCITALANKGSFVPYRDSKLTRLLKDSLGGNARTVMITCVSPAGASFEETCNSLKYANRAKNIKTAPAPKVADAALAVSEYDTLITGLRHEVAQLKVKLQTTIKLQGEGGGLEGIDEEEGGLGAMGSPRKSPGGRAGKGAAGSPAGRAPALSFAASARGVGGPGISGAVAAGPAVLSYTSAAVGAGGLTSPPLLSRVAPRTATAEETGDDEASAAVAAISAAGGRIVVPEGYVLVNVADAAAAGEKMSRLREALMANFGERMQVRRSLMELTATNSSNTAEVTRKQAALVWLVGRGGEGAQSVAAERSRLATIAGLRRDIGELGDATARNAKVRADLQSRLERAEGAADHLRGELEKVASSEERLEMLSLETKVYLLEITKAELEQAGVAFAASLAARDAVLARARDAIRARDALLRQMLTVIASGGERKGEAPGSGRALARGLADAAQAAIDAADGDLWASFVEHCGPVAGGVGEEEEGEGGGAGIVYASDGPSRIRLMSITGAGAAGGVIADALAHGGMGAGVVEDFAGFGGGASAVVPSPSRITSPGGRERTGSWWFGEGREGKEGEVASPKGAGAPPVAAPVPAPHPAAPTFSPARATSWLERISEIMKKGVGGGGKKGVPGPSTASSSHAEAGLSAPAGSARTSGEEGKVAEEADGSGYAFVVKGVPPPTAADMSSAALGPVLGSPQRVDAAGGRGIGEGRPSRDSVPSLHSPRATTEGGDKVGDARARGRPPAPSDDGATGSVVTQGRGVGGVRVSPLRTEVGGGGRHVRGGAVAPPAPTAANGRQANARELVSMVSTGEIEEALAPPRGSSRKPPQAERQERERSDRPRGAFTFAAGGAVPVPVATKGGAAAGGVGALASFTRPPSSGGEGLDDAESALFGGVPAPLHQLAKKVPLARNGAARAQPALLSAAGGVRPRVSTGAGPGSGLVQGSVEEVMLAAANAARPGGHNAAKAATSLQHAIAMYGGGRPF
jgi:hypothetical protein